MFQVGLTCLWDSFCEWIDWLIAGCLYSAILHSRANWLCSHMILHEWIAFYSAFQLNIHQSGVLTVLAWLVPQETAAISVRFVYTIQPCTMSLHAKPHHDYLVMKIKVMITWWRGWGRKRTGAGSRKGPWGWWVRFLTVVSGTRCLPAHSNCCLMPPWWWLFGWVPLTGEVCVSVASWYLSVSE